MDRQQFLEVVESSWREFDQAIAGLSDDIVKTAGVVEDWSIADLLGHVTAWEQQALSVIDQWQRGVPIERVNGADVDSFNAKESKRRHRLKFEQVREEMADTRKRLLTAVEKLSSEAWNTVVEQGDPPRTLGEVLAGVLGGDKPGDHAAEHARHIQEWRTQHAS